MNSTSFFYNHASQRRYENRLRKSCCRRWADPAKFSGHLIDFNVRANGWLLAPQLILTRSAKASAAKAGAKRRISTAGVEIRRYPFACEQPDSGHNHREILFVRRSNASRPPGKVKSICSNICWAPTAYLRRSAGFQRRN